MSHFIGLCFGEDWESNLEMYDESLEVEKYVKYTKDEAIDKVKQERALRYENAVKALDDSELPERSRQYYQDVVDKGLFISYEDAWKEAKGWGYDIDEVENLVTTYNPNSKWDWYSIGGRWDNYIYLKEKDHEGNAIQLNQAYFNEIDWEYMTEHNTPFCFVDLDGEWNERGEMGWWACVNNEKPESDWDQMFREYIQSIDENCLVTAVDFHI